MNTDMLTKQQRADFNAGRGMFAPTKSQRAMSYDVWVRRYQPQRNTVNRRAPFDGTMYETYGPEVEAAWAQYQKDAATVWTLIDCEGKVYISAGWHRVNRLGYFVCAVPFGAEGMQRDVFVG
jgi:hypothetical protein